MFCEEQFQEMCSRTLEIKMFMLLPASMGLVGSAEAGSLTGWSRGGEGPSSSLAELESDFLFNEPVDCFP